MGPRLEPGSFEQHRRWHRWAQAFEPEGIAGVKAAYGVRARAPESRRERGPGDRSAGRAPGSIPSAAGPGHVDVWGRATPLRPGPRLQPRPARGARGQAAVRRGRAPSPRDAPRPRRPSGAQGSSPGPGVAPSGAAPGPCPLPASVFPFPRSRRTRALGRARPGARRPPRGAGQQRGVRSAPALGSADAHGRALTWPPRERLWAGGAGKPRPSPPPPPPPSQSEGVAGPVWGDALGAGPAGAEERARGPAARGGRAEAAAAAAPGTATQRAGGRDRAGQAPQPAAAAAAASPLRARERGGGRAACENGRSGGRGAAPSVLSGGRRRRGPAPR